MLGFPQEDADIFRRFIHTIIEDVGLSAEEREAQLEGSDLDQYLDARIAGAPAASRATISRRSCSRPSSTVSGSTPTTCAARWSSS